MTLNEKFESTQENEITPREQKMIEQKCIDNQDSSVSIISQRVLVISCVCHIAPKCLREEDSDSRFHREDLTTVIESNKAEISRKKRKTAKDE
jgi:hypothetical protein